MPNWTPVTQTLPKRGQRVRWLSPSGEVVTGTYRGVWLMDDGVYVYYEPTYWQPYT